MEQGITKEEAMDLTLVELEKAIPMIKKFVKDMENSKIGVVIKDHPDYDFIQKVLDNLRILVQEYKRDLYEEYGHTHDQ